MCVSYDHITLKYILILKCGKEVCGMRKKRKYSLLQVCKVLIVVGYRSPLKVLVAPIQTS